MKTQLKAGVHLDLIAKMDFMQSIETTMTLSDDRFLETIKERLRAGETVLRTAEFQRLDDIFEKDVSRRVYRVTAADKSFARLPAALQHQTPAVVALSDPFADIGKKAQPPKKPRRRKPRPK